VSPAACAAAGPATGWATASLPTALAAAPHSAAAAQNKS
jgi:hypothetical protein